MTDHLTAEDAVILKHALTCSAEELFRQLQDATGDTLKVALKNPACSANHLLALLKRRDLQEDQLKAIGKHPIAVENHQVKVAITHHPATPAPQLAGLLKQLYLFELTSLCTLPGATADMKMAAERTIILRLPGTPLGNKITLARRATAQVLEALVKEGDPQILGICLDNPHLKESSLFQLIKSSRTSPETLSLIARHPRWQGRPNLKLAILGNSRTPAIWFMQFLPSLTTAELKRLAATSLNAGQQKEIRCELKRRGV